MSTNLSNWRESPYNIWGFQNVDKLINTHTISKGSTVSQLESSPNSFNDFRLKQGEKMDMDLPAFMAATDTDGLVVLHHGKVIFEKYDRTNTASSKHILMSETKSVSSLVAGILVEQGKLNVDDLVSKYVPEVAGTPYEHVTVRHCLDMRTGIHFDDSTPAYREAAGWNVPADGKKANLHDFIANFDVKPVADPNSPQGAPFDYVSVNTDLMGWIIERAAGKKLAELISELLWQPMGAESDALLTVDSAGNGRAAGGMCATVRDVARLGQLILEDGKGIVPSSWIHDILHNGSEETFAASAWAPLFPKNFDSLAYRSYWTRDRKQQIMIALGIHGQTLMIDRVNQLVLAKTSSQPDRIDAGKLRLTTSALSELQRILTS